MAKSEVTSSALVVVNGAALTNKQQLARFQKNTAKQIVLIAKHESDNVMRRLFIGLALHVIKGSVSHGEWTPWLKKHVPAETSLRQCQYMMAVALVWIEESGVERPAIAALHSGTFSLKVKEGAMRKLADSANEFVGELTWGELLAAHDIKERAQLGGAREKGDKPERTAMDAEQLYLKSRDEIGSYIQHGEDLFLKQNSIVNLHRHPEEALGAAAALCSLGEHVKKAVTAMLSKKTA